MAVRTQQELYDIFITELQSQAPQLTDLNEGSLNDVIAGVVSYAANEVSQLVVDEFSKTYFETANGPEITGSSDDLQRLAVDHFGSQFARPGASQATGTVTFTRPNSSAGTGTIAAGTVVKTVQDSTGAVQRFVTVLDEVMTGNTIQASVQAVVAGTAGNVAAGTVTKIETTLFDPTITVSNAGAFAGGAAAQDDSTYRETIRQLIETLKGATLAAIKAKALTVAGVVYATPVEFIQPVINYNVGSGTTSGSYYNIVRTFLYIADTNGTASQLLIQNVLDAVNATRASGVQIQVIAAVPYSQDFIAHISLNPSGPNFTTLESDTSMIVTQMISYIQSLPIGSSFLRGAAQAYIMGLFGPSGTNDLTAFTIATPTGDVTVAANNKLIPGNVAIT